MVLSDLIFLILIVFDIYSLYFYFKCVFVVRCACQLYIIKRIWYDMVW